MGKYSLTALKEVKNFSIGIAMESAFYSLRKEKWFRFRIYLDS